MNIERMNKLADLLEADAANPEGVRFDLGTWGRDVNYLDEYKSGFVEGQVIPINCNTAACAFGLAAISGAFKDDGLTYQIDDDYLIPEFEGKIGIFAATKFFDLRFTAASYLFDTSSYNTIRGAPAELEVVRRIRSMVGGTSSIPAGVYDGLFQD